VPISHEGYLAGLGAFEFDRARAAGAITLVAAPLYHLNAQSYALGALYFASTVVLLRRFDVAAFVTAIERHRVDEVSGVPTMLALALNWIDDGHPIDGGRVTLVSAGSAPLSERLIARLRSAFPRAAIGNSYGTTETGIAAFGPHPEGVATPPGSLGYPMPGIGARLVGPGAPEEGELELSTRMMAAGYHRRPEETRARFIDGWYRTGDVMRRDADGFYYFVGRADDMLVSGGENVYPAEVERLLESHPGVLQAAVVALEDEVKGQVPVAFVVTRGDPAVDAGELDRFARSAGPSYARPRRIAIVTELPLAGTNKIDRGALSHRAAELWGRPSDSSSRPTPRRQTS
jgi:acyl-CoA synthetase (AMP-forming)/AMP-acid ligase II